MEFYAFHDILNFKKQFKNYKSLAICILMPIFHI